MALAVGTLWDGRIRVWSGLRYKTTTSAAAGAPWTEWTASTGQPGDIVCAAQVTGANLVIFSNGTVTRPGPPGSLRQPEPLVMIQEVIAGPDTATGWSAWPLLPDGYALAAGGVLGGQLSMGDLEFTSPHSTVWLWAWTPDNALYTSAVSGDGRLDWTPFPPGAIGDGAGVLWNLYGPNDASQSLTEAMLWHAPAINPAPASTQPFLTLSVSTFPSSADTSFLSSAVSSWTGWQQFGPQLPASTGGVASLAACFLPEGNVQVFASDTVGGLWTIWQRRPAAGHPADWIWPGSWQEFPVPGGGKLPVLSPGSLDVEPASLERNALALAQLATGELQLFALDGNGAVWTTFKTSTEPAAPWSAWETF